MTIKEPVIFAENQTFPEKLKSLELGQIARKLMHSIHGLGWTRQQVARAIANYKRFLYLLYLYPSSAIVPTQEIDEVWHQHILDTRKYAEDCQWLFGYFVHHYPYFGIGSEAEQDVLESAFTHTQFLFVKHFGIDLIEDNSNLQEGCAVFPKNQPHRPSACIELKVRSFNSPSACIELSTPLIVSAGVQN